MLTIPTATANRLNNCERLYPSMTISPGLHPSWKGAVNSLYGPRGKSIQFLIRQADIVRTLTSADVCRARVDQFLASIASMLRRLGYLWARNSGHRTFRHDLLSLSVHAP